MAGKVAIVTGASKGIGAGVAKSLADEGAKVVVNYNGDREGAERVVREIEAGGGSALAIQADVAKRDDAERLCREAAESFGKLDILVNNAGVIEFRLLEEIDEDHFHRIFNVNVLGLLLVTKAATQHMGRGGSIVNIGSVTSKVAVTNHTVYSGSKAAVDFITPILAHELGPRGIRINTVGPGMVPTEGLKALGLPGSPFQTLIESKTPLGRIGTPKDIGSAVVFFASDEASWITGEVLIVAGGVRSV